MASLGLLGLFRSAPVHPVGTDGRMALSDHFRELRARLMRSLLVIVTAMVVAFFFKEQLLEFLISPYNQARTALGKDVVSRLTINGVGGPLTMLLKVCGFVGFVATSPYWLYQLWAFVLPGLHPRERRYTFLFILIAGPLFLGGVALGFLVMPKGIEVLIGFTNSNFTNLVEFNEFFTFLTRMLLVFGIAMEIPLFVILLNLIGMVSGKALGRHRPWIVIGTFVFAAVATPSTDAFSMLLLAAPMLILFAVSEVVCRVLDRRRGRAAAAELSPDEKSPLP